MDSNRLKLITRSYSSDNGERRFVHGEVAFGLMVFREGELLGRPSDRLKHLIVFAVPGSGVRKAVKGFIGSSLRKLDGIKDV